MWFIDMQFNYCIVYLNVILKILEMLIFIVIILCEGDIDDIVYINEVFKYKLFVIVMKGLGKVVDLVFVYLEK